MLGPCAGGAAYSPALTDFVFMVRDTSQMFITGPDVVQAVTGEEITHDGLGGADVHAAISGRGRLRLRRRGRAASTTSATCSRCCRPTTASCRRPSECDDPPDRRTDALLDLVPADPNRAYDMRDVIAEIVDDGEFFEVHEALGPQHRVRPGPAGRPRRSASSPTSPPRWPGCSTSTRSEKAARFVQICDAFNIPLVTLVDVPGFLPGVDQEHGGIIRHGAKLLYAYCDATVPRIQLILRKAYGGAYIVMDSRSIGADLSFAWPTNEIAVMGAEGAANVIFRREIAAADDPEATRAAS